MREPDSLNGVDREYAESVSRFDFVKQADFATYFEDAERDYERARSS
jgi:hypothetical protein